MKPSSCLWLLLVTSVCSMCLCNENSNDVVCIPSERLALIDLKNNLSDSTNHLSSWVGKDCCTWSGVVCDSISGHVHEIHLCGHDASSKLHMLGGTITPSIINLLQLRFLDLSYNDFGGVSIPAFIASFQNLVYLNLAGSNFRGEVPHQLGNLSTLSVLDLHQNDLEYSKSLKWLKNLKNLRFLDVSQCRISEPILASLHNLSFIEYLDLSKNQIVEEIPKSFRNHCNFTTLDLRSNKFYGNVSELFETFSECESPKLEVLALSDNNLTGQLPERLGNLKSLESIYLASNRLTGTLPDSLGSLSQLQILDISGNQLSGLIPDSIGGLSSLFYLDLSKNKLNGSLPESIGLLGQLSSLILENNKLTGIVTENHFTNLTALEDCLVGDNNLVFKLNVNNNWNPPFQLSSLSAPSSNLGPRFPSWIRSQTDLALLDVANANISDFIPDWFWTAFPLLNYLNISHNNIQGKLRDLSFDTTGAVLDLSNNHFHGMLPLSFIGGFIDLLDVSNNNLSGSLQQLVCSTSTDHLSISINVLDLANNRMSGVIPDCWMNWESLYILNLENNQFSGVIPSSLANISSLQSLNINGNKLSGNLPPWLLNSSSLVIIELAENELTGKIPSSIIYDGTSLRVLSLRSNMLQGKIPDELCHLSSIQILDLANNHLSGSLPTCFTNLSVISGRETSIPIILNYTIFRRLMRLPETSLVTKGNTYTYSTILYQVTLLDLSDNKLSGTIPDEIIRLSGVRFLNLSHNNLTGRIPDLFNKSAMLECLDLSMNHLNGNIPLSLSQLNALSCLNVSNNNLQGRIPTGPQLQTFNLSSFTGNALCGDPLPACLPNNGVIERRSKHEQPDIDWILVILILSGLVVGFWIMLVPLFLSKRCRKAYYHFLDTIWFKLQTFMLIILLCLKRRSRSR